MNYKSINGKLLLDNGDDLSISSSELYVRDRRISFIPFTESESFETVDARDHLIMPGLINMHTHAYMTLLRSYADDVPFDEWLFRRVMPVEDSLPAEAAFWTSLLAFIEMIKTGTTTFNDM